MTNLGYLLILYWLVSMPVMVACFSASPVLGVAFAPLVFGLGILVARRLFN